MLLIYYAHWHFEKSHFLVFADLTFLFLCFAFVTWKVSFVVVWGTYKVWLSSFPSFGSLGNFAHSMWGSQPLSQKRAGDSGCLVRGTRLLP